MFLSLRVALPEARFFNSALKISLRPMRHSSWWRSSGRLSASPKIPLGARVLRTLLERMPPVLLTPIVDELPSHTLEMCTEAFTRAGLQAAREGNSVPGSAADGEESDATELIVELYEVWSIQKMRGGGGETCQEVQEAPWKGHRHIHRSFREIRLRFTVACVPVVFSDITWHDLT